LGPEGAGLGRKPETRAATAASRPGAGEGAPWGEVLSRSRGALRRGELLVDAPSRLEAIETRFLAAFLWRKVSETYDAAGERGAPSSVKRAKGEMGIKDEFGRSKS